MRDFRGDSNADSRARFSYIDFDGFLSQVLESKNPQIYKENSKEIFKK